jgi:hypothetical protein
VSVALLLLVHPHIMTIDLVSRQDPGRTPACVADLIKALSRHVSLTMKDRRWLARPRSLSDATFP